MSEKYTYKREGRFGHCTIYDPEGDQLATTIGETSATQVCNAINDYRGNLDQAIALLSDILEWDNILPHSKSRIKTAISKIGSLL